MKDRLIELIEEASQIWDESPLSSFNEICADHLLANGVIVPPVKVGQTVYAISLNTATNTIAVHRGCISSINIRAAGKYLCICHEGLNDEPYFKNIWATFDDVGKTVFLTREDADALMRDIGETVLFSGKPDMVSAESRGARTVVDRIETALTVDAVEVVRCRDCKHYTPVEGGKPLCALHTIAVTRDDFCSYGERRTDV